MLTTMVFSSAVALLSLSIALLLATQADKQLAGAGVYRTLLIWPYAVAPAVAGVLWIFMFQPSLGVLARGLRNLGVDWNPLLNDNHAMIMVVLAATWKQISYNFLFFLAGLQAIPRSVIEAAAIDGARPMRRFWTIIFPLLSPTTFFLLVVNIVYAFFDTFGIIDAMTGGGPSKATETLVYKVYADGRLGGDLGGSAAQSVILMIIVIGLTAIQFRYVETQGELLMPSVMWKELTAEDLRAKAADECDRRAAGGLDGAARAASAGRRRHLPVRGGVQGRRRARRAGRAGGGRADAVVRHGRASHGVRRHVHVRHPDLPGGAVARSSTASSATASSACSSSTATAATSRRSMPSCRTSRARPGSCSTPRPISSCRRTTSRSSWKTRNAVHHACEVETSMMMVVAPATVKHDRLPEAFGCSTAIRARRFRRRASIRSRTSRRAAWSATRAAPTRRRARSCSPSAPRASRPR